MSHSDEIYKNRAQIDKSTKITEDCTLCECCHEELVFAMKDKYHEFSLGLSTILECVSIAEKEGYIPEIPFSWWCKIRKY